MKHAQKKKLFRKVYAGIIASVVVIITGTIISTYTIFAAPAVNYDEMVILEQDSTSDDKNDIISCLDTYPDKIMSFINEKGWVIKVRTESFAYLTLKDETEETKILGLTEPLDKTIYLLSNQDVFNCSVPHEIGHAIDSEITYDYIAFHKIAEKERDFFKNRCLKENIVNSDHEYFAELVGRYLDKDYAAFENTPESLAFIENILNNL